MCFFKGGATFSHSCAAVLLVPKPSPKSNIHRYICCVHAWHVQEHLASAPELCLRPVWAYGSTFLGHISPIPPNGRNIRGVYPQMNTSLCYRRRFHDVRTPLTCAGMDLVCNVTVTPFTAPLPDRFILGPIAALSAGLHNSVTTRFSPLRAHFPPM